MNRKVIIAIVLSLCSLTGFAQQDSIPAIQFGYLSYSQALKSMPAYTAAQKSLDDLRGNYEKELQRSEAEFSKQFAEYVDGQKSFPENILLKRQKELQQLMETSISFKEEAKRLLAQAEVELMQPVNQQLNDVIAQIAKKRGYAFVLNTDNNTAPYVNGNMGEDITADVIEAAKK